MIRIIPYQESWPNEFFVFGAKLRTVLDTYALRIDHIGSTSINQLAAKDIIDIQVTVRHLNPNILEALQSGEFIHILRITGDHIPPGYSQDKNQWKKWLFRTDENYRPVNVHVRLEGRANQRYALLFRDYLRANQPVAMAYAQAKRALAQYHAGDINAYYDVKDPICDIIIGGAEMWAEHIQWLPSPSDC
jgi:GrpB-like predicted nucleotidyltransferase (UPF0157 family)